MLVTKKHIEEMEKLVGDVRAFDVDLAVDYGSLTVSYGWTASRKKTKVRFVTPEEMTAFLRGMDATINVLQDDANA